MNLNKAFILGRLTRDPELRQTPSGQSVTTFGIATNRVWNDKSGNKQESVEFHNVVLWGRQAEVANQYLRKGQLALVEGRLQTRTWEGQDGQKRKTTEIIGERMQMGPRPQASGGFSQEQAGAVETEEVPTIQTDEGINPEEIPF